MYIANISSSSENAYDDFLCQWQQSRSGAISTALVDKPEHFSCIIVARKDHFFGFLGLLRIVVASCPYPAARKHASHLGELGARIALVVINKKGVFER